MDVPGTIRWINEKWFSDAYAGRRFSVSLPSGSYEAEFLDENGQRAWPEYVEEYWAKEPDCASGFASLGDVTLLKPDVEPQCTELVLEGGPGTHTSTEPWIHTMGSSYDIKVGTGVGVEGTDAILTENRQHHWTGLGQDIDSRCLEKAQGDHYEFTAWVKITAKGVQPQPVVQDIDTDGEWWQNRSPILTFNNRKYRDDSTKEHMYMVSSLLPPKIHFGLP